MEQTIYAYAEYFAHNNSFLAYVFFFINASLQALFPPYPGDTIIVFQGYIGTLGVFSNFLIVLTTLLGTVLSGIFLFVISYKYGDNITSHRFFRRFFDVNKIDNLHKVFNKYGVGLILFNRFVPGCAMITVIAAGIFKLNRIKAIASLTIAGIVHNCLLMALGYTVGYNMPLIREILIKFNKFFILLALLLALIIFIIYLRKKKQEEISVKEPNLDNE
ncbi:DedA family protein [Clostridium cylindrosporum]|uniref:VTT domain-containing protein n=1 Tax=Clostridium cylindrosporum DSM 605 TaxID=1121307 RepID=A0A0J8D4T4_CLOCY|nr:VTT domain-containing protein [Clostridium cylindrosporum]KMT20827.1 hypothetical protein CLCY_1c00610 [Clostridium cylindrosporum DSM 605]